MGSLHLVGGEKGGVGKSVVARLLCQFFIDQQREFGAFDADRSHPALLRYYAGYSQAVELDAFEQCDGLLLTALTGLPVIVDMPAQSERALNRWLDDSGVADVAAESGVRVVRWHVMDDSKDALRLLQPVLDRQGESVDFVIVRNLGRGSDFDWMQDSEPMKRALDAGATFIDLPALHAPTMAQIDRIDASFWAACHNHDEELGPCLNVLERQRVKIWLERAFRTLAAAHPSLQLAMRSERPVAQATSDSPEQGPVNGVNGGGHADADAVATANDLLLPS